MALSAMSLSLPRSTPLGASKRRAQAQLDEGYSEETRSQDADSEMLDATDLDTALHQAFSIAADLPIEQRKRKSSPSLHAPPCDPPLTDICQYSCSA